MSKDQKIGLTLLIVGVAGFMVCICTLIVSAFRSVDLSWYFWPGYILSGIIAAIGKIMANDILPEDTWNNE